MRRGPTPVWPLVGVVVLALAPSCDALPPVRYQGELRSNNRGLLQDSGEKSLQSARSLRLSLDTYLWRPWFATAGTAFEVAHQMGFGRQGSQGLALGGHGRVDVFPQSRFPFAAFVDVTDSQLDFDSSLIDSRDARRVQFGISQRYRRLDGRGQALARLTRSIQETTDGDESTLDRGVLQGRLRFERHTLNASVNAKNESSTRLDDDLLEVIVNGRHHYRPNDELNVESFATITDRRTKLRGADSELLQSTMSSFATWRPDGKPYTVDANARWSMSRGEGGGVSATTNTVSLNGRGSYRFSPALRVSGDLTAEYVEAPETSATRTSQSLSASYTPPARPLGGFTYSWFANGNVGNSDGEIEGARQRGSLNLGHSISRAMPVFGSTTTSASFSGTQSGTVQGDTIAGGLFRVVHQASGGLARATASDSSQLRLSFTDSRSMGAGGSFAAEDTAFQSADLLFSHNTTMDQFSSWSANLSMGFTAQSFDRSPDTTSSFTQANAGYRHSRFLGVARLRFRSQLTAGVNNLVILDGIGGEDRYDVRWETEATYRIGLLNGRLRLNVNDVNSRSNFSALVTIWRTFGGVF